MVKLFIAFLTLLAGVASSTQGLFNGYWKDKLDLKTVLLANSLVVLSLVIIFYIITSKNGIKLSVEKLDASLLVGGACGFFIILVFAISFPSIGALATSFLFIIAFLSASLFYDHIGALNLTPRVITTEKVIGVVFVIVGSFLSLRSSV
ncbi:MAG: DMT family transporter [Campylobacterales bacterium]|nr:DMT family transporter [Campylobacterales bacterium]